MTVDREKLYRFLCTVDKDFPKPLSRWMPICDYTDKLMSYGTFCPRFDSSGEIIGLVAGYVNAEPPETAFISCVAVRRDHRGEGIAASLVREFFKIAEDKGYSAVRVYTERVNTSARALYSSLGFEEHPVRDESRPDELHLIKYL